MNTAAFKQALRQNTILFRVNLIYSFIFVVLTVVVLAVLLVLAVYNPILPDSLFAGLLRVVGGGGFVGVAFRLSKAALSFSKEAAKCQEVAFEIALRSNEAPWKSTEIEEQIFNKRSGPSSKIKNKTAA